MWLRFEKGTQSSKKPNGGGHLPPLPPLRLHHWSLGSCLEWIGQSLLIEGKVRGCNDCCHGLCPWCTDGYSQGPKLQYLAPGHSSITFNMATAQCLLFSSYTQCIWEKRRCQVSSTTAVHDHELVARISSACMGCRLLNSGTCIVIINPRPRGRSVTAWLQYLVVNPRPRGRRVSWFVCTTKLLFKLNYLKIWTCYSSESLQRVSNPALLQGWQILEGRVGSDYSKIRKL